MCSCARIPTQFRSKLHFEMNQRIAVVGDVHGAMWATIRLLSGWERARRLKLDFVLQVGDFEPHRDEADLATMAAPAKYRHLGGFPSFARGEAQFPWPIHFIGGNHEPYGWLETLRDGGQIAPNCYFLGRASVTEIAGIRVAGLSGIWKSELFNRKRPPVEDFAHKSNKEWIGWNKDDIKALLGAGRADVLLFHEWPGSLDDQQRHPPAQAARGWIELLLESLRPKLVCCGHAHFRFRSATRVGGALVPIECLAQVSRGRDAFAVYETDGQTWREIL